MTLKKRERISALLFSAFFITGFIPALIALPVLARAVIGLILAAFILFLTWRWFQPFQPYAMRSVLEAILITGAWTIGCDPKQSTIAAIFLVLGMIFVIVTLYSAFIGLNPVKKQKPKGFGKTRLEKKLEKNPKRKS